MYTRATVYMLSQDVAGAPATSRRRPASQAGKQSKARTPSQASQTSSPAKQAKPGRFGPGRGAGEEGKFGGG